MNTSTLPSRAIRSNDDKSLDRAQHSKLISHPRVIYLSKIDEIYFTRPGLCTVVIGYENEPLFKTLHYGFSQLNFNVIESVKDHLLDIRQLTEKYSNRKIAVIDTDSILVDIFYRDQVILGDVPISNNESIAIIQMSYNGGDIDPAGFQMKYFPGNKEEIISSFVLLHQPNLNELEQTINKLNPEISDKFNLSTYESPKAVWAAAATLVVASVTAATAAVTATGAPTQLRSREMDIRTKNDQQRRELSEFSSLKDLLEQRKRSLLL